jgi:hypothetical protein
VRRPPIPINVFYQDPPASGDHPIRIQLPTPTEDCSSSNKCRRDGRGDGGVIVAHICAIEPGRDQMLTQFFFGRWLQRLCPQRTIKPCIEFCGSNQGRALGFLMAIFQKIAASGFEVLSLRQLLRMIGQWPDDLPSNKGGTMVVAGLDACLDLMAPEQADAWLGNVLKHAILSFQDAYQGEAALVFWLPVGPCVLADLAQLRRQGRLHPMAVWLLPATV